MEVRRDEQRVVVEHLLEVRDEPALVDRVAVEAAADQVVHASGGHGVERLGDHGQLAAAHEQLEGGGGRELRSAAEAAEGGVEDPPQGTGGVAEDRLGERVRGRPDLRAAPDRLHELLRRPRHVVWPLAVRLGDRVEDLAEARQPVARLGREVGAPVERLACGRQEHRHRPAAVPRQRHDRVHVQRVEIGSLLPVDLDVDEELVHLRGRRVVLERLVLHDVAPVAGGVADGEQDRLVLGMRAAERLLAPRVPVDRVVRVLEEVGAGFLSQAVHLASLVGGACAASARARCRR